MDPLTPSRSAPSKAVVRPMSTKSRRSTRYHPASIARYPHLALRKPRYGGFEGAVKPPPRAAHASASLWRRSSSVVNARASRPPSARSTSGARVISTVSIRPRETLIEAALQTAASVGPIPEYMWTSYSYKEVAAKQKDQTVDGFQFPQSVQSYTSPAAPLTASPLRQVVTPVVTSPTFSLAFRDAPTAPATRQQAGMQHQPAFRGSGTAFTATVNHAGDVQQAPTFHRYL